VSNFLKRVANKPVPADLLIFQEQPIYVQFTLPQDQLQEVMQQMRASKTPLQVIAQGHDDQRQLCIWGKADVTIKLVQPTLEVEQDVHLLTVKFFKREELGEVKLSILKEGNDNVCFECRDGHAHYTTRIIQLQPTAGLPTVATRHILDL
jgi:hypothetical protein